MRRLDGRWTLGILALALQAVPAAAQLAPHLPETYHVLHGRLTDAQGREHPLAGEIQASRLSPILLITPPPTGLLFIDDFALVAGELALAPAQPIEYQGLTPAGWLVIGDQLHFDEEGAVEWLRARSGGELVAENADEVTFRFLELRAQHEDGGFVVGEIGGAGAPRRLHLAGRLVEVDQSFDPLTLPCPSPPSGGGIVLPGGGLIAFGEFDLGAGGSATFVRLADATISIARVTGAGSVIGGDLIETGGVELVAPGPLVLAPVTSALAPTLEELGIEAPSGATLVYQDGALTVETAGDLFVSGDGLAGLADLTSLTLIAGGRIEFAPDARLPPLDRVSIDTGVGVEIPPGVVVPPVIPFCPGLRPIFPAEEREIGTFSLVATAAEPIAIDVQPGEGRNRVRPGSRERLPVAILGSPELDPRDLDPRSPRLGPDEAAPHVVIRPKYHGRHERETQPIWLGLFSTRETGVAFGDEWLCLAAERRDGGPLEGCDAIDTRPRRRGHAWDDD